MSKIDELIGEFSNASMDWVKAPRHCPDKIKRYKDARAALRSAFEELEHKLAAEHEAHRKNADSVEFLSRFKSDGTLARVTRVEVSRYMKNNRLPHAPAPESGEK